MPAYTDSVLSVRTEILQEPQLCYRTERGTWEQDEQGLSEDSHVPVQHCSPANPQALK